MQVLQGIEFKQDERMIVGPEGMDDAGVFRLTPDLALVQTVDFFPPVVDDPHQYGRIAAVNSLSDVYAMGATPLTGLQIVGFPKDEVPLEVLRTILEGAAEAAREADLTILGGHSVVDQEIKFGLSVTGEVHPDKVVTNGGAKVGDRLYLTKPIGMGTITTAHKKERVDADVVERACQIMGRLNRKGAEAMIEVGVHAATDITGFGLMGHATEVARGSGLTLEIESAAVPVFENALELASQNLLSGGAARTRDFLQGQFEFAPSVRRVLQDVMFDAETSGGLLIAVAEERANALEAALRERGEPVHLIGRAVERQDVWLRVR